MGRAGKLGLTALPAELYPKPASGRAPSGRRPRGTATSASQEADGASRAHPTSPIGALTQPRAAPGRGLNRLSSHLFIEHSYGHDELLASLRADRDAIREFDQKNPSYRIIHDNLSDMTQVLSDAGTYKKGGWTLHMLRGLIGDTAFWTGIRDYYRTFRDGNATTADFRHTMEQASGQDLRRPRSLDRAKMTSPTPAQARQP